MRGEDIVKQWRGEGFRDGESANIRLAVLINEAFAAACPLGHRLTSKRCLPLRRDEPRGHGYGGRLQCKQLTERGGEFWYCLLPNHGGATPHEYDFQRIR